MFCAGLAYILLACLIVYWMYRGIVYRDDSPFWIPLVALPPLVILNMMLLSLGVFPIAYSVFGKRRRTPAPDEPPLQAIRWSWIKVGRMHASRPAMTWRVHRGGLAIEILRFAAILGFGGVFLPRSSIVKVGRSMFGNLILTHNCPEIRSPVKVPADVVRAVEDAWGAAFDGSVSAPSEH